VSFSDRARIQGARTQYPRSGYERSPYLVGLVETTGPCSRVIDMMHETHVPGQRKVKIGRDAEG